MRKLIVFNLMTWSYIAGADGISWHNVDEVQERQSERTREHADLRSRHV
jgi:hypothetical protein